MKLFGKLVLAGALSLISLPAFAHDHHHRGRREHCPPGHGRDDHGWRAPAPPVREVWVPGHWVRRGHGHVWVTAGWNLPPQPAWVWVQPQWVWTGGSWQWQEAHWSPPS